MNSIIDTDNARYKVMGYGEWKENREKVERREGIEGKQWRSFGMMRLKERMNL